MAENNTLLEKLDGLVSRFEEVSTLITDPNVIADQKRYVKLTKEYKELNEIIKARKEYMQCLNGLEEARLMMAETDPEMREIAREEAAACEARIPELEGRTSAGKRLPVIRPAEVIFMDAYTFRGQPVLLLENRMRLPGHGFLGIRFFERFRVIFDFRRSRLRIAEPLSAADTRAAGPDCSRAVLCSPDATRFLCVKSR